MLGRTDRRLRLIALLGAFVLVAGALGARLGYWTVVRAADLSARAAAQLEHTQTTPARRGGIYDRSGTILLATTSYRNLLEAYPAQLTADQGAAVAARLDAILGLDGDAANHLRDQLTSGTDYAVLARELTDVQSEAVREGLADGSLRELALEPQAIRVYPDAGGAPGTTLASQLLGFVNASGNGQYGLEQRYQTALAGRPRVSRGLVDIAGRPLIDAQQAVDPGQPGANLRLTLDAGLQLQLEKELYSAMSADRAAAASAVVIDADTGAVRAWASVPGYDANDYAAMASTDPGRFVDPIASQVYEPGSVMKMFVAAAGYGSGKIAPGTKFNDSGTLKVGDYVVADADHRPMGWLRFEDGIAYSRNVVASRAAFTLGSSVAAASRDLFDTWRQFGIGQPTGVDVAGEVPGIVADPSIDRWAPIDLANRSFGQAVAVTPIQLATSFAEMANGGHAIEPHVVAAVDDQPVELPAPTQVISAKLSSELRALMVHVVTSVPYYAADTLIPHYLVGGKTGTAQIWDPKAGDWLPNTFNLSFVGFVGRDKPQEIVALRLSRVTPKVVSQGVLDYPVSHYALFRRIAIDVIDALDIPPAASAPEASSSSASRP